MLWKTAALAAAAPNPGVHKLWVLIALAVRRVWTNFRVGSRIHRDTPGFPPKGCGSPLKNPQIYPHLLIFPALRAGNRGWPGRMQARLVTARGKGKEESGTSGRPPSGTAAQRSVFALLLLDPVGQLSDLVVDGAPFGHQFADLAVRMDHGGVVPAPELLPDLGQRHIGQLAA